MSASACLAAPQAEPVMALGGAAPTPVGFIAFCERQPLQCGNDQTQVLLAAASAAASAAAGDGAQDVVAAPLPAATETARFALTLGPDNRLRRTLVTTIGGLAIGPDGRLVRTLANASPPPAKPAQSPPLATPAPITASAPALPASADQASLRSDASSLAAAQPPQPIAMTPDVWSKINHINAKVNRSMIARTDEETYGVADYWDTPLEEGREKGDCEDFVLEKRRALIEAGVPAHALNIALVITDRGESHAVLLVSTRDGDFVLDNLSPWVRPWNRTSYRWVERQVDGSPFKWAMIEDPARVAFLRAAIQREIARAN